MAQLTPFPRPPDLPLSCSAVPDSPVSISPDPARSPRLSPAERKSTDLMMPYLKSIVGAARDIPPKGKRVSLAGHCTPPAGMQLWIALPIGVRGAVWRFAKNPFPEAHLGRVQTCNLFNGGVSSTQMRYRSEQFSWRRQLMSQFHFSSFDIPNCTSETQSTNETDHHSYPI